MSCGGLRSLSCTRDVTLCVRGQIYTTINRNSMKPTASANCTDQGKNPLATQGPNPSARFCVANLQDMIGFFLNNSKALVSKRGPRHEQVPLTDCIKLVLGGFQIMSAVLGGHHFIGAVTLARTIQTCPGCPG